MIRTKSKDVQGGAVCYQAWIKDMQEAGFVTSSPGPHASTPPPMSGVSLSFIQQMVDLTRESMDGNETTASMVASAIVPLTAKAKKCR